MGNSHTRHKGAGGGREQHVVHSLPRDRPAHQQHYQHPQGPPGAPHKPYNGGFKVLPERIPGQKLRLTDNGNVLHNGGTLSGRRVAASGGDAPDQVSDAEFMKVLRHRSDSVQDMRLLEEDEEDGDEEDEDDDFQGNRRRPGMANTNLLAKKYHSNPDLLNCSPGRANIDGHPAGGHLYGGRPPGKMPEQPGKKKKLLRKTKAAPCPPPHQQQQLAHHQPSSAYLPSDEQRGKRGFAANFLKPAARSNSQSRSMDIPGLQRPSSCHYNTNNNNNNNNNNIDVDSQSLPIVPNPPPPPLARVNADVVAAKMDSRDKSVTYVLERRPHQQCSPANGSVLSAASVPNFPYNNNNMQQQQQQRHQQMDDAMCLRRSGQLPTSSSELQKRVLSMDGIATRPASDGPLPPPGRFLPQEAFNKSMDNFRAGGALGHGHSKEGPTANIPLGRRLSNRSSQLSSNNDQRANNVFGDPKGDMGHRGIIGLESANHPQHSYFYGGGNGRRPAGPSGQHQQQDIGHQQQYRANGPAGGPDGISASLDRRHAGGAAAINSKSMNVVQRTSANMGRDPSPIHEQQQQQQQSSSIQRTTSAAHWNNRNLDNFSKDKLRPMTSKDIASSTPNEFMRRPVLPDVAAGSAAAGRGAALPSGPVRDIDVDLSSEDEMDISMQLRPTLPKRLPTLPRFSPTQVWRSFSLEELTAAAGVREVGAGAAAGHHHQLQHQHRRHNVEDRCSDSEDEEEGDVFEERIHRIARPIAPPRSNNEKSGDSGISPGAHSPTPANYDFNAVLLPGDQQKLGGGSSGDHSLPIRHQSLSPVAAALLRQKQSAGHSHLLPVSIGPTSRQVEASSAVHDHLTRTSEFLLNKPPAWTPEEDLQSDFDAGSGDHCAAVAVHRPWKNNFSHKNINRSSSSHNDGLEMVASQPKLTSRKDMFFLKRLSACDQLMDASTSLPFADIGQGHSKDVLGRVGDDVALVDPTPATSAQKSYNSVRKLKRSLSGALQAASGQVRLRSLNVVDPPPTSLDENWSLSRSLPNSLHSGLEESGGGGGCDDHHVKVPPMMTTTVAPAGSRPAAPRLPRSESGPVYPLSIMQLERRPQFADLEGRSFVEHQRSEATRNLDAQRMDHGPASAAMSSSNNRNGRIVYLPKYEAIEIVAPPVDFEDDYRRLRTYSDLGAKTAGGASYVSVGGAGRSGNSDLGVGLNNNRGQSGAGARHQRPKKFTYQSTVRQIERKQLEQKLSEVVAVKEKQRSREMELVNMVEEEFQRKRGREKANIRQQLRILSMDDDDDGARRAAYDDVDDDGDDDDDDDEEEDAYDDEEDDYGVPNRNHNGYVGSGSYVNAQKNTSSGIFSGIGKWMKRQQRLGKSNADHQSPLRQAPEGASAPSSPGNEIDGLSGADDGGNCISVMNIPPPVPHNQQNRNQVVIGAKFSSGRTPPPPTGSARPMLMEGATHAAAAAAGLHRRPQVENHANRIWIT